jgi:hypothetical protein
MVKMLADLLRNIGSAHSAQSLAQLTSNLNPLALADTLEILISQDYNQIQRLAALSYEHINGFQKLVIASESQNGPKIRLHIWRGTKFLEKTHSHSWDFASFVLFGRLRITRKKVTHGAGSYDLWSLPNLAAKTEGQQEAKIGIEIGLEDTHDMVLEPGEFHYLDAGMFHSVQNLSASGTCTLFLQSSHKIPISCVVTEDNPLSPYNVSYFQPDEYLRCVTEILLRLRAGMEVHRKTR